MATVEFELKDSDGVDTEIGDIVEVHLPEIEIIDQESGNIEYYRPRTIVHAKVIFPPSKGLKLKVQKVIEEYSYCENFDSVSQNQIIDFRRTVWQWRNLKTNKGDATS